MQSFAAFIPFFFLSLISQVSLAIPTEPVNALELRQSNRALTSGGDAEFHTEIFNAHNFFRAKNNASALLYNEYLRDDAQGSTTTCDFTQSVRISVLSRKIP
jgi:hypothetical protein